MSEPEPFDTNIKVQTFKEVIELRSLHETTNVNGSLQYYLAAVSDIIMRRVSFPPKKYNIIKIT